MKNLVRSVGCACVAVLLAGVLGGCALVGTKRVNAGDVDVVRVGLINGAGERKYLLALHDGDLPEDSIALLQLWSYKVPAKK
ncbi:MAG: hypothetical protein KF858_08920 [Candidatus Sumerlaeia bacterium]|nr:hypothetical protein [Candidatus Sumerlaeia bacterium]